MKKILKAPFLLSLTLLATLTLNLFFMPKSISQAKAAAPVAANTANSENVLFIDLKYGRVVIELMPAIAPKHVERIKTLANRGFYDGIPFHRVIDGFMAQTGDPTGTGTGSSELPDLRAEFNNEPHLRGAVSMARASSPNSANSQFFIVTKDSRFLDKQYTLFGRVIDGMQYVDMIKKGEGQGGMVKNPDVMVKVRMANANK